MAHERLLMQLYQGVSSQSVIAKAHKSNSITAPNPKIKQPDIFCHLFITPMFHLFNTDFLDNHNAVFFPN